MRWIPALIVMLGLAFFPVYAPTVSFQLFVPTTTYYVDPAGSDSNDGLAPGAGVGGHGAWLDFNTMNSTSTVFPAGNIRVLVTSGYNILGVPIFIGSHLAANIAAVTSFTIDKSGATPWILTVTSGDCAAGNIGMINLWGGIGVTIQNGILIGNGSCLPYGVYVNNFEGDPHIMRDITIQNMNISNFWETTPNGGVTSAEIWINGIAVNTGGPGAITNIQILNNSLHGASTTALDDNGIASVAYAQNLLGTKILGNHIYNIGGQAGGASGAEGNGIILDGHTGLSPDGATPLATSPSAFFPPVPSPGPNWAEVANNLFEDLGANNSTCGGPSALQVTQSDRVYVHNNKSYRIRPTTYSTGCDWAGYDCGDILATNVLCEDNYSSGAFGPDFEVYMHGTSCCTSGHLNGWGPVTIRWNVGEGSGKLVGDASNGLMSMGGDQQYGLMFVYNNTIRQNVSTTSIRPAGLAFQKSAGFGSIFGNNLFAVNPDQFFLAILAAGNSLTDITDATFVANGWVNESSATATWYQMMPSTNYSTLAAWKAVFGDTGAVLTSTDPFVGTGIDAAKYLLTPAGPFNGTGANLAASPYLLNVGATDFYGAIIAHNNMGADGR